MRKRREKTLLFCGLGVIAIALMFLLLGCGVSPRGGLTDSSQYRIPFSSKTDPLLNETPGVYITQTGTKYHRDGCKYLKISKISISLTDAKQRYTPCSVCNP